MVNNSNLFIFTQLIKKPVICNCYNRLFRLMISRFWRISPSRSNLALHLIKIDAALHHRANKNREPISMDRVVISGLFVCTIHILLNSQIVSPPLATFRKFFDKCCLRLRIEPYSWVFLFHCKGENNSIFIRFRINFFIPLRIRQIHIQIGITSLIIISIKTFR